MFAKNEKYVVRVNLQKYLFHEEIQSENSWSLWCLKCTFFFAKTRKMMIFWVHIPFLWTLWTLREPCQKSKNGFRIGGFARIYLWDPWTLSSLVRIFKNAKSHEADLYLKVRKVTRRSKRDSHKISNMKTRGWTASKSIETMVRVCKHNPPQHICVSKNEFTKLVCIGFVQPTLDCELFMNLR